MTDFNPNAHLDFDVDTLSGMVPIRQVVFSIGSNLGDRLAYLQGAVDLLRNTPTLSIADLGCGTGLCGPLVRGIAGRLEGCDLSAGMLAKAERRHVYDGLHHRELVAYLQSYAATFDALVCADNNKLSHSNFLCTSARECAGFRGWGLGFGGCEAQRSLSLSEKFTWNCARVGCAPPRSAVGAIAPNPKSVPSLNQYAQAAGPSGLTPPRHPASKVPASTPPDPRRKTPCSRAENPSPASAHCGNSAS